MSPAARETDATSVFRVVLRMQIRRGMSADFERTWLEVGESVTGHPANRGQWLMRDSEDDDVFFIMSDWADEPGFREFEHSDGHVAHREKLHPYREGGSMSTMIVLAHLRSEIGVAS